MPLRLPVTVTLLAAAVAGVCLAQTGSSAPSMMTPFGTRGFCPAAASAPSRSLSATIENKDKQNLLTLLSIADESVMLESRSADWRDDAEALGRVREVLGSNPGRLTASPAWAEFVGLSYAVHASFNKGTATIEIANYHVCVQDPRGQVWFFRTVPVDGWTR